MDKKRVIVDYKNITQPQLELLSEAYPYGFEEDDYIKFVNSKGETVYAIPLETDDTKYLFKVSVQLQKKVEDFLEEDEDTEDFETTDEGDDVTPDPNEDFEED
ncbi:MAG: hypothetical protein LPK46_01260 [Bacteroidota bacterium]|nr:hypothetical protein [Bacteroidota bacterium]MDX5426754.1 hypothetical protein [Bacteroidota bacterium]MDX5448302.1 hypothetical protein [Bacteroidota bacterium]MDX5504744.1 hypothetical protein [Bacteroidota bacterium]